MLECVGAPTFDSSLRVLKRGGRVVLIGLLFSTLFRLQISLMLCYACLCVLRMHSSASFAILL